MKSLLLTRVTLVWLLLVIATAASWTIGHGAGPYELRYTGSAIMGLAFVKVRLVIHEFMEIRTAPPFMRIVADGWLLAIVATLITVYLA